MLEPLLSPGTVAVIGASRNPKKIGYAILDNLIRGGFTGEIVPVNASADSVQDRKSYRRLKEYTGGVDLGLICVPAQAVEAAVEEIIDAGARAVVVVSAGFKEIGAEGAEREERLKKLCQEGNIRLLGPRSLGVINTRSKLNASFAKHMPTTGGVSVLSESGAMCTAILDWAAAKQLGLAKVVSIGNKADLNEIDLLKLFAEDDETRVVVGYLESISSGDMFIKAAEQLASEKPVVIYRAGITGAGARAVRSHTGNSPGEDIAYGAAFKRAGVVRADSLEALFDCATALAMQPLPQGNRVAIVTNAGGPGVVAADALEKAGLQLACLGDDTTERLREKLPLPACVLNPIDVLGDADPQRYAQAVQVAQRDESVDAVIMILAPHAMTQPAETARAAAGATSREKPTLAVFLGSADALPGREDLADSGLPEYPSPERAVEALSAMREYSAWRARPPRVVTRFPVNRRRVERLLHRQRRTGRLEVGEVRAKEILRAYAFEVPEGHLAMEPDAAVEAAERVGYPVAMKIVSPDIIHKSDAGGVKLRLSEAEQVLDAFDLLTLRFQRHSPEGRLEGIYVEKMCPRGLEVVIGFRRDPQFGPILLFGLGGIFVEALKDEAGYLAPVTADEAMQMLMGTRSYELLVGARGQPSVDVSAVARGLQRISQLATDFNEIAELEINPFIITAKGSEPIVVDARMVLAEPQR
jgi:acetyltransferase